jgi:hypothetical protein
MTRKDFWRLIDSIDRQALDAGDEDGAIRPLEERLRFLSEPDLETFEEHLSQSLHALDGQVFADASGESGASDDGFLYARCYVVARGKAHYESTLNDPTLMPKTVDHWCEALLYPHRRVWAYLTGKDQSEWAFEASVSYESGSNEKLWPR